MITPRARLAGLLDRAEALLALATAEHKAALPATEAYSVVRADYAGRLFDAWIAYAGGGARTAPRNASARAIAEDFPAAFYSGAAEAGAEEVDADDEKWLTARVAAEMAFLDGVFDWLKEARDAETVTEPAVRARVEMWAATLDAVHAEGVMRGKKNRMLTWHVGPTEHCDTCAKLNGQRHRAKWYIQRDYIPRKPGAAMACGGYRCQCTLTDDDGNEVTIQ